MRRVARVLGAALLVAGIAAAALALALRPPAVPVPPRGAVLEGVTLVRPGLGRAPGRTLRVEGTRIAAIGAARPDAAGPFAGRFVLPGLVDLHVHHPPALAVGERELFAALFLRFGVTSVRDTGSAWPAALRRHRTRIRTGEIPGPRLFTCGPFVDGDPPGWPAARVVQDPARAPAVVEALRAEGVDCLKLYNHLTRPVLAALQQAAHEAGLPVVAHVPWVARLADLHDAEVQHGMGLPRMGVDPRDAEIARYVEVSRRQGLRHTPTLVAFARAARLDQRARLARGPAARLLPRYHVRLLWDPARNPLARAQAWQARERTDARARLVGALHRAGVPVYAGSDTMNPGVPPGTSLHEELRRLAAAGLGAEGVWAAATRGAGEALGVPGLGTLRVGAPADLLVFARDPTRDLAALDSLEAVVADGRLYRREALEEATARLAAPLHRPPYAPLAGAAASLLLDWIAEDGP